MPVTTFHQFIDRYPARSNHSRLLLGSIHPHNVADFRFPYFYGNVGSLWDRLSEAFPNQEFHSMESIVRTMANNNVWVSDMIRQCEREHAGIVLDKDLRNLVLNTDQIRTGLRDNPIDTIYFTSAFVGKLFEKAFNIPIQINPTNRETTIPSRAFGRSIRVITLYSPSRSANVGIAGSPNYKQWVKGRGNQAASVNLFRAAHYQEKMPFLSTAS